MKIIVSPIPNDETRNVMALLPVDIVYYNILTKLPPKSVLRFKSVCKDWYNLINSSNFINIHHQHTLESYDSCNFLVVCNCRDLMDYTLFYTYLDAPNYTSGKCMGLEKYDSYGQIIGSSNGLICSKFLGSGFLLCNPVTREYSRLIEPPSLASVDFRHANNYGFGYDVVSRDYKIVNIEFRNTKFSRQDCIGHVYSTNSNSWKEVGKNPDSIHNYNNCGRSVVVNNRLHWIIFKNLITGITTILTFDLHAEEFREISYPTSLEKHVGELELMVSGGRLCTLATDHWTLNHPNISIWVMKEYGLVESWTKLYEVGGEQISSRIFRIITHLSRRDGEEVLLLRYDGVTHDHSQELVWYNLKNKSITGKVNDPASQLYANHDRWVCVASLAPIPGNDPNNRRISIF